MKIIIAGAGKVGCSIAQSLEAEGHDLTLIDRDSETIEHVSNELDVICCLGSATNPDTLREAGAEQADVLMAVTESDEVNMICALAGRRLGAKYIVARIRDPEYLAQTEFLREAIGLSVVVNPEYECAKEISRILRFPSAVRVDAFSKGSAEIVEHKVAPGSRLDGMQLKDLNRQLGAKVLVGVVERGGEANIPNGLFTLRTGDRLSITGSANELRRFFIACGSYKRPVRRVMIIGGSRTAVYLARMLLELGMDVVIVERDRARCEALCDLVPKAHIVCGDATRSDVLLEDGLGAADAFVALTGEDGDNVITSMYARDCGVPKIVAKVNREHFSDILESSGLDSIVTPKFLVAQQLARYVRAMENSLGSRMETLYRLADGQVEALEFKIAADSALVGTPLKDLKLKPNILISTVIRGNRSIIPDGGTVILPGDHAVIVAKAGRIMDVDAILEGSV